jgi:molecular chaperone DnaJ
MNLNTVAKRDYYEVLGVSKNATEDELKKAYRQKALQHHPDRNPDDKEAEEKFKEAAEAFEILSNPEKRSRYDQFGHAGVSGQSGFGGGGGMSMEDIFTNFGDIFGGGFADFFGFGGNSRSGRRVQRGTNLRIKVKLTLEEIATGVEKKVKVNKQIVCNTCNGSGASGSGSVGKCSTCNGRGQVTRVTNTFLGQMQTTTTCPTCHGEGEVITRKCSVCMGDGTVKGEEIITVKLPPGVTDGIQLSMSGKGNAAPRGGIPGDLIIAVEEVPHEMFVREELNIYYEHHLSFPEAALGTTIEVPTLDGKARVKVPAATQPGKLFRLKGKGLPMLNRNGIIGDQLIFINVYVPEKLTTAERELIEKMNESKGFQPDAKRKDKNFFERMHEFFSR